MVLSTELLDGVDQALAWLRARGAQRLVVDSRQVTAGDAFIAWPGAAHDGRRFIGDALRAGARACLVDAEGIEAFDAAQDPRVAALPGLKRGLGDLAAAFAGHPSRSMRVVAITGTNGKTSSAWWLAQASGLLGARAVSVGTLGIGEPRPGASRDDWTATGLTTPDPVTLQQALARQFKLGVRVCALEASSIGIVEHRLQGLQVEVALFTNFTQDHLDYHGTLPAYWSAKRRLFDWPGLRAAVVNLDDPQGVTLAGELGDRLELWTVSIDRPARLRARSVRATAQGTAFELVEGDQRRPVEVPFIGRFNVHNLLGVVAALRALGHGLPEIADVLPRLTAVPGRLEAHDAGPAQPLAVIDYAHTPDALEQTLKALRPTVQARGGRLWCVFGCGGDRDRSKRPLMGAIAAQHADEVVLTSDNPRGEDPVQILRDIAQGLGRRASGVSVASGRVKIEADRAAAVAWALRQAQPGDGVLVAGKGHEEYQEIAGVRHPSRDADLIGRGFAARSASAGDRDGLTLGAVAQILQGSRLQGPGDLKIRRVHTDTRTIQPGDLYVALRGERFDGHDFLDAAAKAGACAALVERAVETESGLPVVVVPDSLLALQQLATAWRARLNLPLIAVAGSNGKTTTTQMIASILRAWWGEQAAATRGNLNNHIGVPLTLLGLRSGDQQQAHRAAVVELGMNHPGEMAGLAAMAQPTVALVNNAQREHQEFMGTVEAVARENGAVLQALPPGGAAVFPADDEYAPLWTAMAEGADLWRFAWSVSPGQTPCEAEVRGHASPDGQGGWILELSTPGGAASTSLALPGAHNVHNAVAAATAALAAGAPLGAVARGLAVFEPVPGRSRRIVAQRAGQALVLIDDSYNANPDSVRAAIDLLADLPGPRALVLGDMGEVGNDGPAFHQEVGAYAAHRGIECLWGVGDLCRHAVQAAQAQGHAGSRHFESVPELIDALAELPAVASALVKGSRFMRMERVVQALHPADKGGH